MRLSLLGPVGLADDSGAPVDLGPAKRRAVLAWLGLELNHVVATERLLEALWEDEPPPQARTVIHGHVSALRKLVGPDFRLATKDPGYVLIADPSAVDVHRFRGLVAEAASAEDRAAADMLQSALRLWRGPALADLTGHRPWQTAAVRLDEMRYEALAAFAQRLLALGEGADAVAELREAIEANPLQEPLIAALVLCLHQAGRPADALGAYHAARQRLADDLGIDPGARLQAAYHEVLRGSGPPGTGAAGATEHRPGLGARAARVPAQLPRVPSGFVGRRSELTWLWRQVDNDRPVLVDGPAGVGKTALVLRWARQVAGSYPDGQLFASLRGFDPAGPAEPRAVLAGFLRALGTADRDLPALLDDLAALYRTRMAGRRMLVVLDDAGSITQVTPLLPGDPASLVVITSRTRLEGLIAHDGATELSLSAVATDEAIEMLASALRPGKVAADIEALHRLAELCDHLPLALRVAAARLVTSPGLTATALAEELRDEQRRLEALATDDAQVSVEAALSLSFQALPAPAARLFMLLGLHPGPDIDHYAAAALSRTDAVAARRALISLAGCHLAYQTEPGRFASHDLVRLYARGLADNGLSPEERDSALGGLFDFYLATTQLARQRINPNAVFIGHPPLGEPPEAVPPIADAGAGFAWFTAEEKNIRALVTTTRLSEHAWRLAHGSSMLYSTAGSWADQEACLVAGLGAARAVGSRSGTAKILTRLGNCLSGLGRHDEAISCLREAAELIGDTTDAYDLYSLMTYLGHVERVAGQLSRSHRSYEKALAAARRLGKPALETSALNHLAMNWLERSSPNRLAPFAGGR